MNPGTPCPKCHGAGVMPAADGTPSGMHCLFCRGYGWIAAEPPVELPRNSEVEEVKP